jgi:hypothetical protein
MTIQTFRRLLAALHPEASATTKNEMLGMPAGRYLGIAWQAGGQVYLYRGSLLQNAERLGMIPSADMNVNACRMRDELRRTGTSEGPSGVYDTLRSLLADEECDRLVYPIRPTGRDEWGRDLTRCSLAPRCAPADPAIGARDEYLYEHGHGWNRATAVEVAERHGVTVGMLAVALWQGDRSAAVSEGVRLD